MTNLPMVPVGPTFQDVNEMQRLRNIMNGSSNVPAPMQGNYSGGNTGSQRRPLTESRPAYVEPPAMVGFAGQEDVAAMKSILERFHKAAGDTATRLAEDANTYSQSREAVQTQRTPTGARIGNWEVRIQIEETASGKERKLYDIVNPSTRETVANGLVIYEAAHAVVRYLNKGADFHSHKVQEVLDLEETYNRNRNDAMRFKQRYNRCVELSESDAADVFNSRYQVARANALSAQDQIKSILESIR